MKSLKNKKTAAVLSLFAAVSIGCTATGQVDWAKVGGTLLQVAAMNYTGPLVETVDTVYTAFTGQKLQRPEQQQQFPDGSYGEPVYPEEGPSATDYPEEGPSATDFPQEAPSDTGYSQEDSWDTWGEPYPDPDPRANAAPAALAIDFAMLKAIPGGVAPMRNGEHLRDGVGRAEPGDRFGIAFATNEQAYVYIVNVDATGWAQTLFPYPDIPGYGNPVVAGREIVLPNKQLYGLDDARGVETIFVLVARTPNRELEAALEPLRGLERSASVGARGSNARVSVPTVGQRGLVGVVPGATQTETASLDRYFTAPANGELAFSRWFVHD